MENITKFFSEMQMLKRLDHIGLRLAGVLNTDSIADHALISAQIAFVLADMEGADPFKTAAINIFHDNHETRIGDHNKVSSRYLDTKDAEIQAEIEQFKALDGDIGSKVVSMLDEKRYRNTKEGIIAQDADWLEQAIQAKIYLEQGFKGSQIWIDNVERALETEGAKKILAEIIKCEDFTNIWWQDLKKMTYEKLGKS
ncbi:MAG: HD domain-containing protein [bacterium]